ncbi:MAG TPA: hypothetical protein PK478_00740 [Nitrospira sp.]|nr:hypothetical protein [Nitrospira sp.]
MRVVSAVVMASAVPILLLGALALIGTGSAIAIAVIAVILGVIIVALNAI